MKRAISLPGSFILLTVAVICTMGAIISGFGIDVEIWTLAIIWGFVALALPASSLIWRGKGALILLLPILGVTLWRLQEIAEGAKGILFHITSEYSKWIYVPVLFPDNAATRGDISVFLTFSGVVLAALLYFAICLRRSTFLAVLLTAPLIFLTHIIIFTQPDYWYLIGILAVYLTLLIGNSIHAGGKEYSAELRPAPNQASAPPGETNPPYAPRSHVAAPRTAPARTKAMRIYIALSIVFMLLLAAYLIIAPGSYSRSERVSVLDSSIRRLVEQAGVSRLKTGLGWPSSFSDGTWSFNTESVSVADAGVRNISDVSVLEVTVSEPGTYYIRGFAMQRFDGRTWRDRTYTPAPWLSSDAEIYAISLPASICAVYNRLAPEDALPELLMSIERTGDASRDSYYYPYYTFPTQMADDFNWLFFNPDVSILELADRLPELDIPAESGWRDAYLKLVEEDYYGSNRLAGEYLEIDSETKSGLLELASKAGINMDASRAEIADMVAEYISSAGKYTLSPYVTPEDEDFVLHFLQKSKQGYCIHFATAAVLMLRALDVPARFTSGFVVSVPRGSEGRPFEVTDRNAHSWVEVYYDNVGWLMLEVTPPAAGSGIPDGRPHASGNTQEQQMSGDAERVEYPDDMIQEGMLPERPQGASDLAPGQGSTQSGQQESSNAAARALWIAIPAVAGAGALVLGLVIYRKKIRKTRDSRFSQEDTNGSVIFAWKYIHSLNRQVAPPKEVEGIALKARFSQHKISQEERAEVVGYAVSYSSEQYALGSVFKRLWLVWGLGFRVES